VTRPGSDEAAEKRTAAPRRVTTTRAAIVLARNFLLSPELRYQESMRFPRVALAKGIPISAAT
jgi:hypothetical protein